MERGECNTTQNSAVFSSMTLKFVLEQKSMEKCFSFDVGGSL